MGDKWMPEKKRVSFLKITVFILLAGGAALLFIVNNTDLLSEGADKDEPVSRNRAEDTETEKELLSEDKTKNVKMNKPSKDLSLSKENSTSLSRNLYSFKINNIKSRLSDKNDVKLNVSVELFFNDISLRENLKVQTNEVRILIKKILSSKNMSEIEIEDIRKEIVREINSFIDEGRIDDVEFIDFRPVN